eukprot:936116-Amorphochlora_amoeboformis.AAC.1
MTINSRFNIPPQNRPLTSVPSQLFRHLKNTQKTPVLTPTLLRSWLKSSARNLIKPEGNLRSFPGGEDGNIEIFGCGWEEGIALLEFCCVGIESGEELI